MISAKIDLGPLMASLDQLAGPGKESLARRMAVAAGRVYRDEATEQAPMGKAEASATAQYGGSLSPGLLKQAMYVADNKKQTTGTTFVYSVSWNRKIAPHGHLVEFGHWQKYVVYFSVKYGRWLTDKSKPLRAPWWVAAHPFLSVAYHIGKTGAFNAAMETGRRELPSILQGQYA